VLEAGRRLQGVETMDDIKFAIFEPSGEISIIPRQKVAVGGDGSAAGAD
jgi:uncharacterized membrane protein YcaP (DUF421 family)